MGLVTYPLNNILYSAEDAELYNCTRNSGVYAKEDFSYSVSGADTTITISEGIAWIRNGRFSGKVVALTSQTNLTLPVSDPEYPRIDSIVLQFDISKNGTSLIVKQGIASSSPTAPDVVRDGLIYELHLYHVRREVGSTAIGSANVTDLRLDNAYCGLMADSVTSIDTSAINKQIQDLINNYQNDIDERIETKLQEAKDSGEFTGKPGKDGEDGEDGYTPVRGTDYWTTADKKAIVNDVLGALPEWTGGSY